MLGQSRPGRELKRRTIPERVCQRGDISDQGKGEVVGKTKIRRWDEGSRAEAMPKLTAGGERYLPERAKSLRAKCLYAKRHR